MKPSLRALSETRVRRVKTIGRITADLNLSANKSGKASFLSLPRASAKEKEKKAFFELRGLISFKGKMKWLKNFSNIQKKSTKLCAVYVSSIMCAYNSAFSVILSSLTC